MKRLDNFRPTAPRDYNDLKDCGDLIIKSSLHDKKILKEIDYYRKLSSELQKFHVSFIAESSEGKFSTGYSMKKIPFMDLSFFRTEEVEPDEKNYFLNFFKELDVYFSTVTKKEVDAAELQAIMYTQVFKKLNDRILLLEESSYFFHLNNLFKSYGGIKEFSNKIIKKIQKSFDLIGLSVWQSHGDLCFSNVIYGDRIYLIDPRGDDGFNFFMSPYYDFAKLSQSIYGGYDFINHGLAMNKLENEVFIELDSEFKKMIEKFALDFETIRLIECSHFLAMLPLHLPDHEKVDLFACRAIEIAKEYSFV